MNVRRSIIAFVAAAGVVGWCDVASATSYEYGRPLRGINGDTAFGVWVTATLLFGFIERPFYSAAGVERNALARSIQINALSSLVFGPLAILLSGHLFGFYFDLITALFPVAVLLLITLVAGLEYLLLAEAERKQVSFALLWLGNFASVAVLFAIFAASCPPIGNLYARYISANENHYAYAGMALTVACVVGAAITLLRQKPIARDKSARVTIGLPPADAARDDGDPSSDAGGTASS